VVPVYNEEENVPILLREISAAMDGLGETYEVVFVDDGSRDRSLDVMRGLIGENPVLRVLSFESNTGQSAALEAGFRAARGEVVITLDADLQNDPADIPLLVAALLGFDAAVGFRAVRQDSISKRLTSKAGNWLRNRLTGEDIADTGCSLKAFRKESLARIKMFRGMHRFLPTLVRMEGYRVTQVRVNHRPRVHGKTKYGFFDRLRETAGDVMAVRWMQRRALRYRVAGEWGKGSEE
jgi:glycosyltransferase involved in cell wall biosynthesis